MRIEQGGVGVYPELSPDEYGREFVSEPLSSGVPEVDDLLNGGFERGTISIISGPSGVGKTTLGGSRGKGGAVGHLHVRGDLRDVP